jgi:hypothetical protein
MDLQKHTDTPDTETERFAVPYSVANPFADTNDLVAYDFSDDFQADSSAVRSTIESTVQDPLQDTLADTKQNSI